MFRFNFVKDEGEIQEEKQTASAGDAANEITDTTGTPIFAVDKGFELDANGVVLHKHLAEIDQIEKLSPSIAAVVKKTDIEHTVYEGGFKLWECSIDLVKFCSEHSDDWFKQNKFLEIGCGHGLPGIYCLCKGADVTFADYNQEVISSLTIPNLKLNLKENKLPESFIKNGKFYSGDWTSLEQVLAKKDEKFDIIMSSDTLYCAEYHDKLINLIKTLLKQKGVAYFATKSYYFGVGGGVRDFEHKIRTQWGNVFETKTVKRFVDGLEREILAVIKKE